MKNLSTKNLRASEVTRILKPLDGGTLTYLRAVAAMPLVSKRIKCYLEEYRHIKLKISGVDLKNMGLVEGRRIGKVLDAVLCLKIDKEISTKKQEINKAHVSIGKS